MRFQSSKRAIENRLIWFCFSSLFLLAGCGGSIPNLETPACTESREAVRKFYSYHLDAGAALTPESIAAREKYLSPEFFGKLLGAAAGVDPFTLTTQFPRAFRLAGCTESAPDKTVVKVILFWKDEAESRQRAVSIETVKENGNWLIDRIFEE